LKKLIFYQIIEKDTIALTEAPSARLQSPNMMGDYLQYKYENDVRYINNTEILEHDIHLHNGIIHEISAVLAPDTANVVGKFESEDLSGRYRIFFQALQATGVSNLLLKSFDPTVYSYTMTKDGVSSVVTIPKYYRYTILAESDETYRLNGIDSYEQLKAAYDDGKGTITDPENGFYRFVAYHCLDRLYDYSQFVLFSKQDGYEIVETLASNTLLEFRNTPEGVIFNRFTDSDGNVIYQGARITGEGKYRNIMANNGMIHELVDILEVPELTKYFNKKMRFNVCSFLPELMNCGYRGVKSVELPDAVLYGKDGFRFFDNMTIIGEAGYVIPKYDYTNQWIRHQFDEILIGSGYSPWDQETTGNMWGSTRYDVTLILPPFPKGITWEVRFGYTSNQFRGMAQIYFDGAPAGIPLWMGQVSTTYYGINGMDEETARRVLYNNDFMPYPSIITNGGGTAATYTTVDRLRRIIGIFSFQETTKHVLRFKTVEPGQLSLNFIEIIPVDQIENEGTD
jgi:hypothetical protein